MMTIDINRFKKNNKGKNNYIKEQIKKRTLKSNTLNSVFPVIHGLSINLEKEEVFNNIIEAREYLNDKECFKNVIDICKYLLKENKEEVEDIINNTNTKTIKSSLTLFNYITNPDITSLLTFRNYDKKLIKKVFTENKEFTIFKKIIDKYFNGETDKETLLIIESEIYEYSNKNTTFNNINKNNQKLVEDLIIKYSEVCPLSLSYNSRKTEKLKIKQFAINLTDEEYTYILKFNINSKLIKKIKKYKLKINEKLALVTILSIIFLSGNTILSFKNSLSDNTILVSSVAKQTLMKLEETENIKEEIQEKNEESNIVVEETPTIEETPKSTIKEYSYISPSGTGNETMVQIASSQVGNIGGETYWRWYGFNSRVPWCGIFISWVANQAGLSTDTIPKFAKVSDGVNWFVNRNLFRNRNYTPRSGDLIFFDYDNNGQADHVGLVKKVENGKIYTVEGNIKNDRCHELNYNIGDNIIYGYGTPNY